MMNSEMISGKWNEVSGELRKKFGELTDNDMERLKGNFGSLGGILEQRLGLKKEDAQRKADDFMAGMEDRNDDGLGSKIMDSANNMIDSVKDKFKNRH